MSVEDTMMDAYNEGLRDEVFGILDENRDQWQYKEYNDKYGWALAEARVRKTKGTLKHKTRKPSKRI